MLLQLTGERSVFATSQLTVVLVFPVQVIPELFGLVTIKGPALPSTSTVISAWSLQPPPGELSRTITLKSILLVTAGRTSHVGLFPAITSGRFGKYLVGLVLGSRLRNAGPSVFEDVGGIVATALSICSQQ